MLELRINLLMEVLIMGMNNANILVHCERLYDELFTLESIIKLTKDVCLKKEFTAIYYELTENNKIALSEERNHYINLLSIALDKVEKLKTLNLTLENEASYYSKTPTIAADK